MDIQMSKCENPSIWKETLTINIQRTNAINSEGLEHPPTVQAMKVFRASSVAERVVVLFVHQ